jgi:hypothetical protein
MLLMVKFTVVLQVETFLTVDHNFDGITSAGLSRLERV